MGLVGFADDYIKVFKKDKEGLKGRFKIMGQVGLGLVVGAIMYFNSDITIREKVVSPDTQIEVIAQDIDKDFSPEEKSLKTTIPFVKNRSEEHHV